ncbi:Nucleoside-transport system protein nupC [Listeria grayi]|uniref:Nucleoside-transport system protein nupC n=1 Tax=Listeria grayi TaxID=1641 RepID=A0A378MID7_LISGR|nr:Nucleoside-transport system protein nupC [Listeria grayi]
MKYLVGIVGLIVFLVIAWLASNNKKQVKYRPVIVMLVLQFVLGFLLLNTGVGNFLIKGIANGFNHLLSYANSGVEFVFGNLVKHDQATFFLGVLMPIIFISALIGILQHWKILPFIVKWIGVLLSKVNGMGKLESYNAVASAILGQSEVFISVKKQLGRLPANRLYTLCASAMSTVSMSIVGSYMTLLQPRYVVTALVLNLFGGFIIASIINPYKVDPDEDILEIQEEEKQSFFEVLGEYIMDGFKVAITVAAMLIGFVAIIALINALFSGIIGISFQDLLGYIFAPFAFLMGVPGMKLSKQEVSWQRNWFRMNLWQ